eukprot:5133442-Pyramimonas_sp.AAC.1
MARHNNPDQPDDAQAARALVVHLLAWLDRWAGAARKCLRGSVPGHARERALRDFVQRADGVVIHPVWDRVFPKAAANRTAKRKCAVKVSRVFVKRLSHLLDARVTKASLAWGCGSACEWTEEVDCFRAFFPRPCAPLGSRASLRMLKTMSGSRMRHRARSQAALFRLQCR